MAKLRIIENRGAGQTSDRSRSVTVQLYRAPGSADHLVRVVNAIRASKIDIEKIGKLFVTVEVPRGDATIDVVARVAAALGKEG